MYTIFEILEDGTRKVLGIRNRKKNAEVAAKRLEKELGHPRSEPRFERYGYEKDGLLFDPDGNGCVQCKKCHLLVWRPDVLHLRCEPEKHLQGVDGRWDTD